MQEQQQQHVITKRAETCIQHKQQQKLCEEQKLEVLTTKCKQCLKTWSLKISNYTVVHMYVYVYTSVCVYASSSCKFYVLRNKVSKQNLPQ